ncbi:MAG: hypothetical protein FWD36_10305 [Treponema sp.]|nr:hypothetical protein [Treponema sp.]
MRILQNYEITKYLVVSKKAGRGCIAEFPHLFRLCENSAGVRTIFFGETNS